MFTAFLMLLKISAFTAGLDVQVVTCQWSKPELRIIPTPIRTTNHPVDTGLLPIDFETEDP
jgi:hypothetical protein